MTSETAHRKKVSTLVSAFHQSCPMRERELHMGFKKEKKAVPQHGLGNSMRRKAYESKERKKV